MLQVKKFEKYLVERCQLAEETAKRYAGIYKKLIAKERLKASDIEMLPAVRKYLGFFEEDRRGKDSTLDQFYEE